jgi:hypothetical protein
MRSRESIADALAAALLGGVWTPDALRSRAKKVLGRSSRAQHRLVAYVMKQSQGGHPPSPRRLAAQLLASPIFDRAAARICRQNRQPPAILAPPVFSPAPAFAGLDIPPLATPGDLAAWLEMSISELDWFADSRRQHARTMRALLRHYVYSFVRKRSGGVRLIESPKPRLKAIQRRILHEILDKAPVHERAVGFVPGRSCKDGAQLHAGEFIVATIDLKDFFPSTPLMRVHTLFRRLGYPWAVARALTGLCSTSTPVDILARATGTGEGWLARKIYATPHLPQGAPTSPALANLSAWRLDRRLSGLATTCGANYSRYADDLTFSGDRTFAVGVGAFLALAARIICEEGYSLNERKTRLMRRSGRQFVTGIVVNDHTNTPRKTFDELKAILHNCAIHGPENQNGAAHPDFRAHLDGRVTWIESVNPARGAKLRQAFGCIEWR